MLEVKHTPDHLPPMLTEEIVQVNCCSELIGGAICDVTNALFFQVSVFSPDRDEDEECHLTIP